MIYFAHPIDYRHLSNETLRYECQNITLAIRGILREHKIAAYDPETAFISGGRDPGGLVAVNFSAITRCTQMLAYLPDGVCSVGTPMEIQYAVDTGMPVTVVGSSSLMITGRPHVITAFNKNDTGYYEWDEILNRLVDNRLNA